MQLNLKMMEALIRWRGEGRSPNYAGDAGVTVETSFEQLLSRPL